MNRNPDVDRRLEAYDNPMKPVVAAIRKLARSFKAADLAELENRSAELKSIFVAWCDLRDGA